MGPNFCVGKISYYLILKTKNAKKIISSNCHHTREEQFKVALAHFDFDAIDKKHCFIIIKPLKLKYIIFYFSKTCIGFLFHREWHNANFIGNI